MRKALALLAIFLGVPVPVAGSGNADPAGVTSTEVSFTGGGGIVLHGTVLAPAQHTVPRRPGIVMLEGAGNRGRGYLRADAEAYARHGIVTLVYDKRTVGYSLLRRDYRLLADDALAALEVLRSRAEVDPDRTGLWALSEGAFVAPLAAARSTDVKFLITVGAVGTTPAVQTAWAYERYLSHAGVTGSMPRMLRATALPVAIRAGLFPEAGFDPWTAWHAVRQPVLAQWGQFDRDSVPHESIRVIGDALARGGNARYTVRIVPGVNHNLHVTAAAGFDRLPALPAGYGDFEAAWITGGGRQAPPQVAFEPQPPAAAAVPAPAWYHQPWLQLAVVATLLVAFAAGIRRRGGPRWLAVPGLATVAGTLAYVVFLLATAAKVTGPVVFGRTLPWLALQLLAVVTTAATVAVMLSWRRHHRELETAGRIRLAILTAAGILFTAWAASWGLLTA
ncbi:MAG TPA: hypothetical protein VF062_23700 [Candidatus Limnocylindrales bacterium]